MTEEDERLFRSLEAMRAARWNSFDKRRTYEWKFCITLWTALAIFSGSLLRQPSDASQKNLPIGRGWVVILACAVGTALVVIHGYWSVQLSRRNDSDRDAADIYEERMCGLVDVSCKTELEPIAGKLHGRKGRALGYSHQVQIIITALLVVTAICAVLTKLH
jgi:hypothetical protein